MLKKKSGKIINISSTNGINSFFSTSIDYDASKSALINSTHNLAIQFAPYINVNCVALRAIYEYPSSRTDYIVEVKKQAYLKEQTLNYMKELDIEKYCLYSDEDDNNKEKFTRFIEDTNSKPMYLKYYNHFDGYHRIYKIPELNELINNIL